MRLLRLLGWVVIGALIVGVAGTAAAICACGYCAYKLLHFRGTPQPTRRRVVSGRIAR